MSDLRQLEERFMRDPTFHATVRSLEQLVESSQLTIHDIRDAAFLAAMNCESRRPWFTRETVIERQHFADLIAILDKKS